MSKKTLNKKPYEAPTLRKVRLEIKSAVLAVCHSSPTLTPRGPAPGYTPCFITPGCFNTP